MKFRAALIAMALLVAAPAAQAQSQLSKGQSVSATNSNATVTLAAKTNYQWVATGLGVSCATTPSSPILATIKDGSATIFSQYITAQTYFPLDDLSGTPGNSMTANLAACGSGVAGSINLKYKQL